MKSAALSDRARPAEMLNDNNIAPPINVKRQLKFPSKSEVVGSKGVKLLMIPDNNFIGLYPNKVLRLK